ncbi:hypothetical protein GCM10011357_19740 [Lacimicrobium alkaliphilum]|uniref:Uncharacterized protein n=1 Tax=Lacimicrobium alkaliphilum TaxID=1526571 RepID=A0ABQ1RAZ4_9ALTE|nr:hypothetical protein GCM10011357_19740 [Lacimicrobium alkaliphilum]
MTGFVVSATVKLQGAESVISSVFEYLSPNAAPETNNSLITEDHFI